MIPLPLKKLTAISLSGQLALVLALLTLLTPKFSNANVEQEPNSPDSRVFETASNNDQLDELNRQINSRQAELRAAEKQLEDLKKTIAEDNKSHQRNLLKLKQQSQQLESNERELELYAETILESEALIEQQEKDLSTLNQGLAEKSKVIDDQKFIIILEITIIIVLAIAAVLIWLNVKNQKQANAKLQTTNAVLKKLTEELTLANEAKSRFLATVSHEIRTPMNGVIGMLEILKDTELSHKQKRYIDVIHNSGELLINIINDVLDYSRIEAGRMSIDKIDFSIAKLIHECATIFSFKAAEDKINFYITIDHRLPAIYHNDPIRIRQILVNLLGNAFKFTVRGKVSLAVELLPEKKLKISVTDTGIGMDEKFSHLIFDAFSQVDTSITRKHTGTGLGLSICKQLVDLLEGEIHFTSKLGEGSCFWITLPLSEQDMATIPTEIDKDSPVYGKNVLIADNQKTFYESLLNHFEYWHLSTTLASNLETLQQKIDPKKDKNEDYEAIILSTNIINEDREKLNSLLANYEIFKKTPTIIVQTKPGNLPPEFNKSHNIKHVIDKPVTPSMIYNALIDTNDKSPAIPPAKKEQLIGSFSDSKILVVEDNKVNQKVVTGLLKKFNVTAQVANNGKEALDIFKEASKDKNQAPFDVIFMDCEMPVMDGYEATRQIRAIEQGFHTKIIALTAYAMEENRREAIESGMDDHITKPIRLAQLQQVLSDNCAQTNN